MDVEERTHDAVQTGIVSASAHPICVIFENVLHALVLEIYTPTNAWGRKRIALCINNRNGRQWLCVCVCGGGGGAERNYTDTRF
jgi:hypothetical protein